MGNRLPLALVSLFSSLFAAHAFATEGRTAGQFAVSPLGGAQYQIPIWAPPGPRGIQPNLALVYNSQSGVGPLGIGWGIAGLGAITRCNKTYAQDTTPAAVALATSDGYCLNGNRLRLTGGTYGAASSTYQTEIADFSNVTANGTAGNGPASFTVQGRDGLTYEYGYVDSNGNGANSQVLATGTTTADSWLLSKVIDRAGNNFVINYTALTGTAVPNTILWTPTSAGAPTYAYTMTFNYTSNVPQSSLTKYIGGTSVTDAKLLSSIAISHSGTVVKDYFLGYQASPTTGRDELISVKECADSTQTNCLLPTSVTYQNGSAGVSTTSTTALSSAGASLSARYDLNGDGYPDLVYLNGSTTYVSFGSATGYGTPVNTGVLAQMIGNLNGGKQDGLLAVNGGTWWYYTWNGTSFTGTSTGLAYDSTANQYQLADVNGDGLPDLVSLYVVYNPTRQKYFANVYTRLNTGTGGAVSFSSTLTEAYSSGSIASAQLETPDMQYGKLRRYDFNGDGCDDVVLALTTGTSPNYTVSTYELISTGTAFTAVLASSVVASSYYPVFFTNWNDDACTDFVAEGTLYISGCNGTIPTTYSVGNVVAAMDWDGDGRTDLVVSNGSTLGVYLSTGAGPASLLTTSIPYTSTCLYVTMDANGDGLDDLGCWSQTSPYSLSYRLHNGAGQPPDLVSSIADGYGNSVHAYYTSIAQGAYTNASDAVYPYQNYIGPYYVAYSATFSDPSKAPGQTYSQSYHYGGAWMNLQGRGFAGFQSRSTTDTRTALYEAQYYERAFPYTGMTYEDVWSNGSVYPTITEGGPATITLDSTSNNQRYFPYFSFVTRNEVEVGGSENGDFIKQTETTYTYDNYGNATQITSTVTDKDPGSPYTGDTWTTQVTNTTDISVNQAADLAAWCLNMLDETQVVYSSTLSGSTSVPRTKTFTPDTPSECRIKTTVTEPTANSGLYKVTEALTFDSFGNVATDTVTGANMPSSPASRLTTLNWGTTG